MLNQNLHLFNFLHIVIVLSSVTTIKETNLSPL